jgi:hypothetical protein
MRRTFLVRRSRRLQAARFQFQYCDRLAKNRIVRQKHDTQSIELANVLTLFRETAGQLKIGDGPGTSV